MAIVQLQPGSINANVVQGAAQSFSSTPVTDASGTAISLAAWVSLVCKLTAITPSPNTADITVGTVTADANGIVTVTFDDDDFNGKQPGTANLIITGKPTAGDVAQLLALGSLQLQAG